MARHAVWCPLWGRALPLPAACDWLIEGTAPGVGGQVLYGATGQIMTDTCGIIYLSVSHVYIGRKKFLKEKLATMLNYDTR